MPAISAPAKILVTGASGYVATWYTKALLDKGFNVVGTVRSDAKGKYLVDLYEKEYPGRFSYAIVTDIVEEGVFDDVIKLGFDGVAHAASPGSLDVADADLVVKPAINGTISILESIKRFGPTVKRVVLTSSIASMWEPKTGSYKYTKADWNEKAIKAYKSGGATGMVAYEASKTLAERSAWEFVNKGDVGFDLVAINPAFMFGPFIMDVASITPLTTSSLISTAARSEMPAEARSSYFNSWADVRDNAEVHAQLFLKEEVAGERVVVSSGGFSWQDILDGLNVKPAFPNTPIGTPKSKKDSEYPLSYDTSLARKLLGREFTTLEKSARDTAAQFVEKGWW